MTVLDAARPTRATRLSATVIICAYTERRWDQLLAAVTSVQQQTVPAAQVVVVIDHNAALLERATAALSAEVVASRGPKGLSGARNTGVAVARGQVVAFLDDDATAAPDWLERLLEPYADPQVLGVGGHIEPRFEGARPRFLPQEFDWVIGCSYRGVPSATTPVRNMIGANMSFRRSVLDAVGPFAESLGRVGTAPLGCEETELCIRALSTLNGEIVHEPSARVEHSVPADRGSWRYFRARCWSEGRSKALVAQLAGAQRGLATERRYVTRVLPSGVLRGVAESTLRRRPGGLARSAAIVAGLAITTTGYVVETLTRR